MTVLKNITWEKDDKGDVIIMARDKYSTTNKIVVFPFGKMRDNITLKTLVKKSITDKSLTLMISIREDEDLKRIQMGPSGNAYATFMAQGLIQEHAPTIHIPK